MHYAYSISISIEILIASLTSLEQNHEKCVRELLQLNADPNLVENSADLAPLHFAAERGPISKP